MAIRLNKVVRDLNVGMSTIVDFLEKKGRPIENNPNTIVSDEQLALLNKEYKKDKDIRQNAEEMMQGRANDKEMKRKKKAQRKKESAVSPKEEVVTASSPKIELKTFGKINLDELNKPKKQENPAEAKAKLSSAQQVQSKPVAATPEKEAAPTVPETSVKPAPVAESVLEESKKETTSDSEVYHLTTPKIPKVKILGTIDLDSITPERPWKKGKNDKHNKNSQKGNGSGNVAAGNGKHRRNRIGAKERIDVNNIAKETANGQKGQNNQAGQQNGNKKKKNNNNSTSGQNNRGNNPQGNNGANSQNRNSNNANKKQRGKDRFKKPEVKAEVSDEDVAKQVKETLARLTNKSKFSKGAKYRKEKREAANERQQEMESEEKKESKILKLTEFVTANELATMMDVPVTKVIGTCMSIGLMVSINQRLDAETINMVAEEFGFKTEFVSSDVTQAVKEEKDKEEDLEPRAPIVTVMGHVDHGKTSLLDYIRKSNVIAGEAGGITQHIGAYKVKLQDGRYITFLDTPGHEAFTAMRARGAQVTDVAIIIVAADDGIKPQTKEAISHATAAGVPIVFAINKIDKPGANPDKVKEELANMGFLVEEWGGKYQSQDISAKKGTGVDDLLEKVLLEAEMLDLKANPNRKATGTILESALDRGRGYTANVLVSNGTLHVGDVMLAGTHYGRVKALFNERNQRIDNVKPSEPATVLGLNGAPQPGDAFHIMDSEQEARDIANKREQLQREQGLRTHKMLTLDEVGRRIALGGFKELNVIVKGDVDGSVEALSDSLIKLSTPKIQVNVIYKGVGQISESDVNLAAASQAIIIGFQVRPSVMARKYAKEEGVDIRMYSVIYDAINEVKTAMEGMLEPVVKENVTATLEVRQVYHISKVGTVAGAFVMEGKVKRSDKARLIRDGIVIFTGEINALKRFKDDVKEVSNNFECGISLVNFNDIKEGDTIETFEEVKIKQKL